jgi:hypothetical protein
MKGLQAGQKLGEVQGQPAFLEAPMLPEEATDLGTGGSVPEGIGELRSREQETRRFGNQLEGGGGRLRVLLDLPGEVVLEPGPGQAKGLAQAILEAGQIKKGQIYFLSLTTFYHLSISRICRRSLAL